MAYVKAVETNADGTPSRFYWNGPRVVTRVLRRWAYPGVVRFGDLGTRVFVVALQDGSTVELTHRRSSGRWTVREVR